MQQRAHVSQTLSLTERSWGRAGLNCPLPVCWLVVKSSSRHPLVLSSYYINTAQLLLQLHFLLQLLQNNVALSHSFYSTFYCENRVFENYICLRIYEGWDVVYLWRSEDNIQELVVSFCHVWPGDWTHIRLSSKCLNLLSHLVDPL